jgi:two-component sensor histidine kinase
MYLINERILIKEISDVLQLNGNYSESNKFLTQYLNLESTFTNEEKNNRISEQSVLLELSEKEAAFQKAKRKALEQKLLLYEKNKVIFIGFIIVTTLLLLILILKYFNKIYKRKNKELETEKRIVIDTNEALNKTLFENKLLLKEIHHRVKNNLQLVMSLLHIQAQDQNILTIEEFIEKGQTRIASMVLIHENLYQNENVGNIDFIEYLNNLTENIKNSFGDDTNHIQIKVDVAYAYFNIQTAIPLGLIINELISNAFKHAFPDKREGSIFISIIKEEKSDGFTLEISDNGIGMKAKKGEKKSLGLELVSLLVMQLNGTIATTTENGIKQIIHFKSL